MPSEYYKLGDDKRSMVPCTMLEWAKQFENREHQVARAESAGCFVSLILDGLSACWEIGAQASVKEIHGGSHWIIEKFQNFEHAEYVYKHVVASLDGADHDLSLEELGMLFRAVMQVSKVVSPDFKWRG